jgi:hypothetical protein
MNDILVGREKECAAISALISQRKNIIIFGVEGTGKSVIIKSVLKEKNITRLLYSQDSSTLKGSLSNLILSVFGNTKAVQELNILTLKNALYGIINEKKPEYIVFDHVESVEPKFYSLFVYLMEAKIPLIVLSHGLQKKDIGHLRMSLFNFEKVEISNLDRPTADVLIDHFIKEFGIKITKEADFKKQIFHFSKGNPKIIKGLCFLARDVKYQKNDTLDVKLMDLDRRISEAVH